MAKYEFVKIGNRYLIKNSNGRIISEKEKLEMENNQLALEDISSCGCQKETTKKISKNKKRIKEIEEKETAQTEKEVDADDIIEETTETI